MKHAYLIMCHSNFKILAKLVSALDNPRNDIYIHVDSKVNSLNKLKKMLTVKKATLTFTRRINVNWGGFSQIKAELILLEEATKNEHAYYHLMSGVDMPLKSQEEIFRFFDDNQGQEFIGIDEISEDGEAFSARIKYYHLLQDIIGRNSGVHIAIAEKIEQMLLKFQAVMKVNRLKSVSTPIYKGANWFSITHPLAEYLLNNKKLIKQLFGNGLCADELFLQTITMASPYAGNVVNDTLRYIDWNRGFPYIFKMEDYNELVSSPKLFVRKFDENVDMEVVERLHAMLQVGDAL